MKKIVFLLLVGLIATVGFAQCEDFEVEITGMNPTCHDFSDGGIYLVPAGGTLPYEIEIMDVFGDIFLTGPGGEINVFASGWYYITVTDSLGCVYVDSVELINPDPVLYEYTVIAPSAPGECDGFAEVDTVYGFQGDYSMISVIWYPGGPFGIGEFTFPSMCANTYTIYVMDEIGCMGTVTYSSGSLVGYPELISASINLYFANGSYWISNSKQENYIVELYDLSGKLVYSVAGSDGLLQLENTNLKGVYLYKIYNQIGELNRGKLIF